MLKAVSAQGTIIESFYNETGNASHHLSTPSRAGLKYTQGTPNKGAGVYLLGAENQYPRFRPCSIPP